MTEHSLTTTAKQAEQLARRLRRASQADAAWERNDRHNDDPMRAILRRAVTEASGILGVIDARLNGYR